MLEEFVHISFVPDLPEVTMDLTGGGSADNHPTEEGKNAINMPFSYSREKSDMIWYKIFKKATSS